jgi:hypothetical protein
MERLGTNRSQLSVTSGWSTDFLRRTPSRRTSRSLQKPPWEVRAGAAAKGHDLDHLLYCEGKSSAGRVWSRAGRGRTERWPLDWFLESK